MRRKLGRIFKPLYLAGLFIVASVFKHAFDKMRFVWYFLNKILKRNKNKQSTIRQDSEAIIR